MKRFAVSSSVRTEAMEYVQREQHFPGYVIASVIMECRFTLIAGNNAWIIMAARCVGGEVFCICIFT